MEAVWLPLHVSVYIPPHLIILHLAAPVSLSATARHWACVLWSGETRDETQGGTYQHKHTEGNISICWHRISNVLVNCGH